MITLNPLTNRPRADACGFADALRRPPALHLPYDPLSTKRCQPGILMHVHLVLLRIAEVSQLQLPRPGPDGQPNESSQLGRVLIKFGPMSASAPKATQLPRGSEMMRRAART